jgi:hypothetical protein
LRLEDPKAGGDRCNKSVFLTGMPIHACAHSCLGGKICFEVCIGSYTHHAYWRMCKLMHTGHICHIRILFWLKRSVCFFVEARRPLLRDACVCGSLHVRPCTMGEPVVKRQRSVADRNVAVVELMGVVQWFLQDQPAGS